MSEIEKVDLSKEEPPSPAVRQTREVYAILESFFDETKGMYIDGYNDDKVALEVGLSKAAVVKLRSEGFAPLQMPQPLADLVARVDRNEKELAETKSLLALELGKYG